MSRKNWYLSIFSERQVERGKRDEKSSFLKLSWKRQSPKHRIWLPKSRTNRKLKRSVKTKKGNDYNQYVIFKLHQKKNVSILGISGIENKTFIFKTLQIVHLLFNVACILIINELKNGFDKPSESEVFSCLQI